MTATIKKYSRDNYPVDNGHYNLRRPGRLVPYGSDIMKMRAQGITYQKIHEYIYRKGCDGTIDSLRVFMQKERTHRKRIFAAEADAVEYVPCECLCQLIYRRLKRINSVAEEQYETVARKYPILGQLYGLLREFHRIMLSGKYNELDLWIETAQSLNVDEIDTCVNDLKPDTDTVKNAIKYEFNNGLAEGSVNKVKLIKRIMYGRNNFRLLEAKVLLNEYYYQIN